MKMNSLRKILIIIFLSAFQYSFAAEARLVKVGAFNNFPVIFQDKDGAFKGLYVDLLSEIGYKENIRFEYVPGTWKDGLDRIRSGEVDLLTSVGYTQERSLFMDYCKYPLLTVWGELYTLKSSEINGILDLSNKKIGVMKGDINAGNFMELIKKFGINCELVELSSYEDVFKAVAVKKVSAGVAGVTFGAAKQKEFGLRSTGVVFNPFDLYFTTAKGKNQDLIMILDSYLNNWKHHENSVYNKAKQKWLYGSVGAIAVVPGWLINALIILGIIIAAAFAFILLMRLQVKKVTDKIRQKEEALRESEGLISSISNNIQSGMIYQVVISKDGSRRFTYLSDSVKILYGITPEEGMADASLIYNKVHKDDVGRLAMGEEEAIKKIATFKTELRIQAPSGEFRWDLLVSMPRLLDDGSVCFDGIDFDITERKQNESYIAMLSQRNQTLLDTATDGIHVLDDQGYVVEANPAFCRMLGYTREEILKLNVSDWDMRWPGDELLTKINELIKHSELFETRHRRKDGTIFDVEINGVGVTLEGRNYLYSSARDITRRKLAEEEREELILELQEALDKIKTLKGLLPICARCKKIRDDKGYWSQIEEYIESHSDASFSHGLCPGCVDILYGDEEWFKKTKEI